MPKTRNMHVYRGMGRIKALPVVDETLDETTGTGTPPDGQYGERADALFCRALCVPSFVAEGYGRSVSS
jgi:hypothetical protein